MLCKQELISKRRFTSLESSIKNAIKLTPIDWVSISAAWIAPDYNITIWRNFFLQVYDTDPSYVKIQFWAYEESAS
jgi:hypothetical protein